MNREIAVALGLARERAGNPSFRQVRSALVAKIGEPCPTEETLRKWHSRDTVPKGGLELAVIAGLAAVYDVPLRFIHPDLDARAEKHRILFETLTRTAGRHTKGYEPGNDPPVVPFRRLAPVPAA
jgi:hypothetical protein